MAVLRLGQQVDRAGLAGLQFAKQQAAAVGAAGADFADFLVLGAVLVGVIAANDTPAVAVVDAALGLDADRLAGQRLACGVEGDDFEAVLTGGRGPVGDLEAERQAGRPQFDAAAEGLDFAVRVGEAHFGIDLARPLRLGRQHDVNLAGAGLVELDGLLVENQRFLLTAVVDLEGGAGLFVEIDLEVVALVIPVLRPARAQRRRNLNFGMLGGAAVEEGEAERQRHLGRCHLAARHALHAAGEDG